jgi:site-specific recombinase XerD
VIQNSDDLLPWIQGKEAVMLQRYFVQPKTIDRIRASWIGESIERYVAWLDERGYAARSVFRRVPILVQFGEFAKSCGAKNWNELLSCVEPFVAYWLDEHGKKNVCEQERTTAARAIRGPIQQMLQLAIPGHRYNGRCQNLPEPFIDNVPGFFAFLRRERGLREPTIVQYQHHLRLLEGYLRKSHIQELSDLSAGVISAFVTEFGQQGNNKRSVQSLSSILKVFLRYLYRTNRLGVDVSRQIESPRNYRLANLPRSISWDEVRQMLESVDRRSPMGKRDYAILLLLVTYGLRAREVAALTLENIDWKRDRLHIPERKAGHSTVYPLSRVVGEAILDYLQNGRPKTEARALFFRAFAPYIRLASSAISDRAAHYLRKAGIKVLHPGSHTLRHSCVQRLVDAHVSFKTIGDYVGHRTPDATEQYAKVNIEALREVALGDGEQIL